MKNPLTPGTKVKVHRLEYFYKNFPKETEYAPMGPSPYLTKTMLEFAGKTLTIEKLRGNPEYQPKFDIRTGEYYHYSVIENAWCWSGWMFENIMIDETGNFLLEF